MNQTKSIKCFPILVHHIENFLSIQECDQLISTINGRELSAHGALQGLAASTFNNSQSYILDKFNKILSIKDRITLALDAYTDEVGIDQVELDNSWVNVQNQDSQLNFHTHPCSALSGALYLKIDRNSSRLYFTNPVTINHNFSINKLTEFTYEWVHILPRTGDLIIFPSLLKHGSLEKNMSLERIVCSFNTVYK